MNKVKEGYEVVYRRMLFNIIYIMRTKITKDENQQSQPLIVLLRPTLIAAIVIMRHIGPGILDGVLNLSGEPFSELPLCHQLFSLTYRFTQTG